MPGDIASQYSGEFYLKKKKSDKKEETTTVRLVLPLQVPSNTWTLDCENV